MDIALSVFASLIAALCVVFAGGPRPGWMVMLGWLGLSFVCSAAFFIFLRTYKVIIRHLNVIDVMLYTLSVFLKEIAVVVILFAVRSFSGFFNPLFSNIWVLILLDFVLTLFIIVGTRIVMITFYNVMLNRLRDNGKLEPVLVYGTSDKSAALIERLRYSKHYKIVGFIEYRHNDLQSIIGELQVYHFSSEKTFKDVQEKVFFKDILFPIEDDVRREKGRLVQYAVAAGVKVLVAPTIDELSPSGVRLSSIREVQIEDLLGRDEIKISLDEIKGYFHGKTVMVTGAAGSIGSEICRQMAHLEVGKIILFDNAETPMHNIRLELESKFPELQFVPVIGDVRQVPRLDFAFRKFRPQVVFHAAAYKHVPLMEENPCEAALVNVVGSRNVADKCVEYDVEKMVMISTDKAVNPTNIMGCTKRLAEIYVQSLGTAIASGRVQGKTKFVTTRFGNVLGSNGSVIPRFREQILAGGPVTVTHPDITRFFMTIPEACRLVMEAATMSTGNQIFVFDMGESVKIDTLARRMIELAGLVPDIDIQIEYSGLRPGEKLYEEVLSSKENTEPTPHERIRIAKVRDYEYNEANDVVAEIENLSRAVLIPELVILMKKTVPEYISNNSVFSQYDNIVKN